MAAPARRRALARAAAALGLIFAALAAAVAAGTQLPLDRRLLAAVDDVVGTSLDSPAELVARLTDGGPVMLATITVVVALAAVRRFGDAAWVTMAFAVVLLGNPVLKDVFERPRPDVRDIPVAVSVHSFPSGHTANTAAAVGAVVTVLWPSRRRMIVAGVGLTVVVSVAMSQLVLGAHYPSDIVAGWSWSLAWIALLAVVTNHPA